MTTPTTTTTAATTSGGPAAPSEAPTLAPSRTLGTPRWSTPGRAQRIVWSPSGRYVFVGYHDGEYESGIAAFEADTRRELSRLGDGHGDAIALLPDGETAVVDSGKSLARWRFATGEVEHVPGYAARILTAIVAHPDGEHVITAGYEGRIPWVRVADGTITRQIELQGRSVTGVALSPDAKTLAASTSNPGGHGASLCVFRADTGELLFETERRATNYGDVLFTRDGGRVIVVGEPGLFVVDLARREVVWNDDDPCYFDGVALSPDGRWIIGTDAFFRVSDGHRVAATPANQFDACGVDPRGTRALVGRDTLLEVLDPLPSADPATWAWEPGAADTVAPYEVAFSSSGRWLYAVGARGLLRYDVSDGTTSLIDAAADWKLLRRGAVRVSDGTLYVLDDGATAPRALRLATAIASHGAAQRDDGRLWASASKPDRVVLVSLADGSVESLPKSKALRGAELSPDGARALCYRGGAREVRRTSDGALLTRTRAGEYNPWSPRWAGASTIAMGHRAYDGGPALVDADTLRPRCALEAVAARPPTVFVPAPPGRDVCVGLLEHQKAVAWDTTTGRVLAHLATGGRRGLAAAIAPDASRCAVALSDASVAVYDLPATAATTNRP